jgi:hypothetical protein
MNNAWWALENEKRINNGRGVSEFYQSSKILIISEQYSIITERHICFISLEVTIN